MAMAPNIVPALPTTSSSTTISSSSRNLSTPLPLSSSQEAEVRKLYYSKVRSLCSSEIAAFAACARGRTITLAWACKAEQFAMNSCMIGHSQGGKVEDEAREEWFRTVEGKKEEERREKAEVERRREVVIGMIRRQEEKERVEEERRRKEGGKRGWFG
jgi:COX assembly mitochondrial protein 1